MASIHKDSDINTPIIFVLSSGADPTTMVINYANEMKYSSKLKSISLGQG
jgi:dynein heavy chain